MKKNAKHKYVRKNRRANDLSTSSTTQAATDMLRNMETSAEDKAVTKREYANGMDESFERGRRYERERIIQESSKRADEKAVIFNGAQETIPVRSVSNQLLISKFKDNVTRITEIKAELSVRCKLNTSLEDEMSFRGLIDLARNKD